MMSQDGQPIAAGDTGGDGVDNMLAEAQALMQGMDTGDNNDGASESIVIGGFSIDDDDDDDEDGGLGYRRKEPPIIDARTKVTGTDPLSAMTTTAAPLSSSSGASVASSATAATNMATAPMRVPNTAANQASYLPPDNIGNHEDPNNRASLTMHPLQDEAFRGAPTTLTTPSFSEVKAKASGFASTMANFAQKAATSMAAAAAGQHPNGSVVVGAPGVGTNTAGTTMPSMLSGNMPPPIQNRVLLELDNDQKQALIDKHIGALLPGEKVLMFLTNVVHVSDSTGWDYSNTGIHTGATAMWCCCMTYYRVVLFYNGTKTMEPKPKDWNPLCWPEAPPRPYYLEMPLSSIDRVEKRNYPTSASSSLMGLVLHG